MLVGFDISSFQLVYEHVYSRRILISCDNDTVYLQIILSENVNKTQYLQVISYSKILTGLAVDNVSRIDTYYYLCLILHLLQELYLGILIKTRQHSHCMLIVYQLPAEFKIQPLAVSVIYSLKNIFGLLFNVLFRIKTYLLHLILLLTLCLLSVCFCPQPYLQG